MKLNLNVVQKISSMLNISDVLVLRSLGRKIFMSLWYVPSYNVLNFQANEMNKI